MWLILINVRNQVFSFAIQSGKLTPIAQFVGPNAKSKFNRFKSQWELIENKWKQTKNIVDSNLGEFVILELGTTPEAFDVAFMLKLHMLVLSAPKEETTCKLYVY